MSDTESCDDGILLSCLIGWPKANFGFYFFKLSLISVPHALPFGFDKNLDVRIEISMGV